MNATSTPTEHGADAIVYLRTEVFDAQLTKLGITTIAAAADLLHCDPGTIHRFRGRRIKQPSGYVMLQWAETLGVSVKELWGRSETPPGDANPATPSQPAPKPPASPRTPPPPSGPKRDASHG